ncbi:ribonucleoside-diphosphate reductase subunit beta [Vibrio phage vB_pir03]|nr:ribonucleoside-diphosphate reductase subunit beta [Vibrio phage vB_pir03]
MVDVFKSGPTDYLNQPMFLGDVVSTARYDEQTHPEFERLISRQLAFFWRPEEINVTKDRLDYEQMSDHERFIFTENLKYQTLLDSIQGRSPNLAFLELTSIPELETWIETWSFSETIHSRSYTHIIRNLVNHPEEILSDITVNPAIIKRAEFFTSAYNECIDMNTERRNIMNRGETPNEEFMHKHRYHILKALVTVNALEAIAFYVSFACSFAFAEKKKMRGNGNIIRLIARDEALHLKGTEYMLNVLRKAPLWKEVWDENYDEFRGIFLQAVQNEEDWADHLFQYGSLIGLNADYIKRFVRYIANVRMSTIQMGIPFPEQTDNPLPWIFTSGWLSSDATQVAPQEEEITDYLTGDLDTNVSEDDLDDLDFV